MVNPLGRPTISIHFYFRYRKPDFVTAANQRPLNRDQHQGPIGAISPELPGHTAPYTRCCAHGRECYHIYALRARMSLQRRYGRGLARSGLSREFGAPRLPAAPPACTGRNRRNVRLGHGLVLRVVMSAHRPTPVMRNEPGKLPSLTQGRHRHFNAHPA